MKTSKARSNRGHPHSHSRGGPLSKDNPRKVQISGQDLFLPEAPRQTGMRSGREKKLDTFLEFAQQ